MLGRCSSCRTSARAPSSSLLHTAQLRTCALSGGVPNPTSPSSSRSISSGSRCRSTIPPQGRTGLGRGRFQGYSSTGGSFAKLLQRLPELVPGAVDVGLDGAQGQVEGGGDLLVGAPFHVSEQDAGAVLGAELAYRLFDRAPELPGLDRLERGLPARLDIQRGRLCLGGGRRVGRPIEAHRRQLAPAKVIDGDVVGDLEQPARKLELGAVAVDVVQDLDEGVLRQVFRGFPVAHHPEDCLLYTSPSPR